MIPDLTVHFGDNLSVLTGFPESSVDLIYIDPPFNTGKAQTRRSIKTVRDDAGDRTGFAGRRYRTLEVGTRSFNDAYDAYLSFLEPRLVRAREVLKPNGSLFFHIDYREVHYCKVLLDEVFGRDSFMNEIIWAYDYGARTKSKWPPKHDNILWYARDPDHYQFHLDECDRVPYLAPSLVGAEKAARGKTPTDTWWHTIVSPTGREKTGYPTQKPLGILERIVRVHSSPGDVLMDFFAGSGSFGEAARRNGRQCVLVDNNPAAMEVMAKRFAGLRVDWHGWRPAGAAGP
jgi:site-specific DNA-methyltransferase (adenine-specific)